MCLQQDLREHGVDPSRLDRAANRSMADNLAALASSALDVAQLFEPYASMALQSHVGRILYAAAARGPTLYTTFIATRTAVERQRDEFSAMTRAMRHMQDWLSRHEAEEFSEIVAPFFPDIARNILANSLQRYRQAGIWVSTPKTARQGFTRLGASLLSGGFISRTPIYEECIDESLQ
jgi:NitT/TauT family transport system substrate-binding protein